MLWRAMAAVVAALILGSSCAPGIDSEEARATKSIDDRFLPYNEVASATITQSPGPLSSERQWLQLLARRDRKTGALTTHARIGIAYSRQQRYHFDQVRAHTTELLPMRELARTDAAFCKSDQSCPHTADLLVDIPEPQLRAATQGGYAFRIYSRDGYSITFPVPSQLITALFKAVDAGTGTPTQTASAKR